MSVLVLHMLMGDGWVAKGIIPLVLSDAKFSHRPLSERGGSQILGGDVDKLWSQIMIYIRCNMLEKCSYGRIEGD